MNLVEAITNNTVDAGIGFSNFHQIGLEELTKKEASILRIDELAGIGYCCFCSILIIAHEKTILEKKDSLKVFLYATERATTLIIQNPEEARDILTHALPKINSKSNRRVFFHTLPIFLRNLMNVKRDWEKVYQYTKHLGLYSNELELNKYYTNNLLPEKRYYQTNALANCIGN